MNEDWLVDGSKIPDEVMGYIRKIAVQAVRENGQSPELIAKILNFNRSCIYEWLKRYDEGGYEALESRRPPGAKLLITREMEGWLEERVLNSTPVEHGYDTNLWTRDILAELLKKEFGVNGSGLSVSLHLGKRGLSYQKLSYRDVARDKREVEHVVNDTFPRIQRLADKMGADIGVEDEAGNSFTSADSIYDRLSWLYAFFRERLFRDDSESIVAALWSESPPAAGTRVLEVGCGPGYYALRLAARFRHSHVIGIDLSQRLIARARGLAKERSLENCQFYCGDAQQLDMPDASVDVAVLCRLLLIVPQRRRTVAEVHRVLRPGGTCFIAEPRPGVYAWLPLRLMRGVAGFCRLCDRSAQWPSYPCGCARPLNWRAFREITDSQPWGRARFWLDMDYQYAVCRKTEQTPGTL